MIHSSYWQPRVYPYKGDIAPVEVDRVQDITGSTALNREKIKEVGRDGVVDWRKRIPSVSLTMRQLEYGSLEFFRKLANVGDSVVTIQLNDFKTSMIDITGYKTDDDNTFIGTVWYPKLRLTGFGINIGDPEAYIERTFNLVGEDEKLLLNANKYFIYKRGVIATTGNDRTVTLSSPSPVANPDASGQFLFRVIKVSGTTTTELTHGTGWSYNGVDTLTINGASTAGDVIKAYYSAGSYISGENPFTNNDTDAGGISADSCSIYLATTSYLYRLRSVGIDVTFDRTDEKEIGNLEVVTRGVREKTVRITLGRVVDAYTIEEILREKAGANYGLLDVRNYGDNNTLIVKIYSNSAKTTFLLGWKFQGLSPTGLDANVPLDDYITRNVTVEGESAIVSTVEAVINA